MASSTELIEPTRTLEQFDENSGKLSVFSEPQGLDVSLDGTRIGKTPIISRVVQSGYHVLQIKDQNTEIYVIPGKNLRLSLHKGSLIEFSTKTNEVQPQKKTDDLKTPGKPKPEESLNNKENLHPLYWPLNPNGPIY